MNKKKELIYELGGCSKVQKLLSEKFDINISKQNITNWYSVSIPLRYLIFMCKESNKFVLKDFIPELD
jgi:hypothetical protein